VPIVLLVRHEDRVRKGLAARVGEISAARGFWVLGLEFRV
jgi:hypothetical protein